MTLTDEQVRALRAEASKKIVCEDEKPVCSDCERNRRIKALATEVLAQRADNARLRAALRAISETVAHPANQLDQLARDIIDAALKGPDHDA